MKALIVKPKNLKEHLDAARKEKGIKAVIVTLRPSLADLLTIAQEMPKIKTIFIAPSYFVTMSRSAGAALASFGIELKCSPRSDNKGSCIWGNRIDRTGNIIDLGE